MKVLGCTRRKKEESPEGIREGGTDSNFFFLLIIKMREI